MGSGRPEMVTVGDNSGAESAGLLMWNFFTCSMVMHIRLSDLEIADSGRISSSAIVGTGRGEPTYFAAGYKYLLETKLGDFSTCGQYKSCFPFHTH